MSENLHKPSVLRCDICGAPTEQKALHVDRYSGLRFGLCCLNEMICASRFLEAAVRSGVVGHPTQGLR